MSKKSEGQQRYDAYWAKQMADPEFRAAYEAEAAKNMKGNNKRFRRLLFIAFAVTCGIFIIGLTLIRQDRIMIDSRKTAESIFLTNTAVNDLLYACEAICDATGNRVGCNNITECGKAWTKTPSPTPKGTPTLTAEQATATVVHAKIAAVETVQLACATLRAHGNATLCPDYWLTEKAKTLAPTRK